MTRTHSAGMPQPRAKSQISSLKSRTNLGVARAFRARNRSILIAAISLVCVFWLPRASTAQTVVAYGTWIGSSSDLIYYYDQYGQIYFSNYFYGPAELEVEIIQYGRDEYLADYLTGPLGFTPPQGFYPPGFPPPDGSPAYTVSAFGPDYASGSVFVGGSPGYSGSFDLYYQSILPGGLIDTTGGYADADFLATGPLPDGASYTSFAQFSGVGAFVAPEPSSIVPMAIGAVVVLTWVVILRRRARKPLARATAACGLG